MKKYFLTFLCITTLIITACQGKQPNTNLQILSSSYQGYIVNNNNILSGESSLVFSLDSSALFSSTTDYLGNLYVGTEDGNIYKLSTSNNTWTKINGLATNGSLDNSSINTLISDKNNNIIVGTKNGNVFQLTNNSWIKLAGNTNDGSINHSEITSIAIDNNSNIIAGTDTNLVYIYTNQNWNVLGNSSIGDKNTSVVAISVTTNNDVYVATSSNQVLVKTNNGFSWSNVATLTPASITALTTNQNNVYITIAQATNNVLQLDTDNNAWNIVGSGALDGYSPTTILVTNNNTYIGTYGGDVYQLSSTNTWSKIGATFVDLSQNAVPVSSLTNYKNHVYASTFAGNNYFITTENSTSWTPTGIGTLDETQILTTIVDTTGNIYAGTAIGNLWIKNKNDTTWTNLSEQNPTTLFGITELAINNNNLIYGLHL